MKELGPVDPERFSLVTKFFTDVMVKGTHLQVPDGMKPEVWEKKFDRAALYYFGKYQDSKENPHETRTFSLKEVGTILPGVRGSLTKERVRQIITGYKREIGVIEHLYKHSPDEVQAKYSLECLIAQAAKPEFLTNPEGITRKFIENLDAGENYESLGKKYGYNALSQIRQDLRDYGIKVPFNKNRERISTLGEQLNALNPQTDVNTLRELICQSRDVYHLSKYNRDLFDQHFIFLTKLLRDLGYRINLRDDPLPVLESVLNQVNIPVGFFAREVKSGSQEGVIQRYYFVYRMQKNLIVKMLEVNPDLKRFIKNPVRQVPV